MLRFTFVLLVASQHNLAHQKILIVFKEKPCEKIINESLFDILMRTYDEVKIFKLVGLYMLSVLVRVYVI